MNPCASPDEGGVDAGDVGFDETGDGLRIAAEAEMQERLLTGGFIREWHAVEQQRDFFGPQRGQPGGEGALLHVIEHKSSVEDDGAVSV